MTALLISLSAALMLFISLRELGSGLSNLLEWKHPGIGLELSIGIACVHFIFILTSLYLNPNDAQYVMFIVHVCMNLFAVYRLRLGKRFRFISGDFVFILLLLVPLFLRTLSPGVNGDSLNIYLPNVEWVVHRGLSFNPYLTGYTTMPMGVEYLFSQVHTWGGQDAVRFLDVLFGVSLLLIIFSWVGKQWPGSAKWVVLTLILVIPGGYRFLFGNGKVDMVSTIVVLTGVMSLPVRNQGDLTSAVKALFLFSLACALKYTNWVLLCLPMLALIIRIYGTAGSRWRFAAPMIPLIFVLPVLIRNRLLTGNPLAPLLDNPDQFVFIASHGGIPHGPIDSVSQMLSTDMDFVGRISLIVQDLMPFFLFPSVALLAIVVWYTRGIGKTQRAWIEWLGLSILPFYGFVSLSVQPVRFLHPQLIVSLVLLVGFLRLYLSDLKHHYFSGLKNTGRPILLVLIFIFVWGLEGSWFSHFVRSFSVTERQWYEEMGEDHAAITLGLVEGRLLESRKIIWNERPVLALVPFRDWERLPTDLELHRSHMGLVAMPSGDFFQFCGGASCSKIPDHHCRVILSNGPWRLESYITDTIR